MSKLGSSYLYWLKRIRLALAILSCCFRPGICQTSPPLPALSGIILNAENSSPIEGAIVLVVVEPQGAAAAPPAGAKTGPDGRFTIQTVAAPQYRIQCEKAGFLTLSQVIQGTGEKRIQGLAYSGMVNAIELRMTPQAVIAGQITDSAKQPLMGATVRLSRVRLEGRRTTLSIVTQVSTDDLGRYRIYGVEPGRYYISASFQDAGAALGLRLRRANDGSSEVVTEDYAVVYYPGVRDPENATPVRLRPGKVMSNIDMSIVMAQSFALSGRVTGIPTDGPPPQVFLQPSDPSSLGANRIFVPPPGIAQFHFRSVPPGEYLLTASINLQGLVLSAREKVTVSSAVSGVSLDLQAPFSVSGVVAGEDGTKIPENIRLRILGIDSRQQADLKTDGAGLFQVDGIGPGEYNITVADDTGKMFVRSIFLDDRQIPPSSVTVLRPNHSVRLVLSDKAGRIKGRAVDGDQHPVSRGVAVLVSTDPSDPQAYATSFGAEGNFTFQALPPGRYRILCFSDLFDVADATWDVQRKVKTQGKDVSVANGDMQQLTIEATQLDPI